MKRWALFLAPSMLLMVVYLAAQHGRPDWGERAETAFPPSDNLRIDDGLVYARYGDRTMHLDLYRPAKVSREPIPGVIVIRGGGFQQGDSKGFGFIAEYLAHAGLAAACIQYRTSGEARFPAAVQDAKAAVRWMRANAAEYRIDPDALGAIGGSAGAYLAAMLATSDGASDLEGDGGNAGVSSRVGAVVAMATPADFVDMSPYSKRAVPLIESFIGAPLDRLVDARRRASPVTYVTRNAAPILLIHSDVDPDLPYEQARLLQRRYVEAGATAQLVTVQGAPHDPWNYARWFPDLMDRAAAFLKHALVTPKTQPHT
jgi:acetyl esterase/lipase